MVQGSGESVREHPDSVGGEQGGREGQKSEGKADHLPPQEEPSVLRYLGQEQLPVWKALHLAPQKISPVSQLPLTVSF